MNISVKLFRKQLYIMATALLGICILIYFYDVKLFGITAIITFSAFVLTLIQHFSAKKQVIAFMNDMAEGINDCQRNALIDLPVPVVVSASSGEIIWQNSASIEGPGKDRAIYGTQIKDFLGVDHIDPRYGAHVIIGKEKYTVYVTEAVSKGHNVSTYYMMNDTMLKEKATAYDASRPVVMMMTIDSYDEALQDYKENERSQLLSQVEYHIEKFVGESEGIVIKSDRDRYVAVLESQYIDEILAKRFEILDRVRGLAGQDRMPLTLSIGVGKDQKSYSECELAARQSLDMALGRGGDQAAVKTANGYDFYGGLSKGIEKRTKVKTRIVATALQELIESASNVIIMGHKFADMDSLGSAVGLIRPIRQMGKRAFIAIDRQKNLVGDLISKLEENGYDDAFKDPKDLLDFVDNKTLLIVVDTHLVHVLESAELYRQCENVVIIDHHRRMVGYIENAVIFYHEPYASSASEMVTELIQYLDAKNRIGRVEAEALLAGIMLDTKNFILRTGVRTFEAAAYLRKQGADTVEVRKLFSSTMESYQQRSRLVASAEIYRRCAIAVNDTNVDGIKIIAPQAADELLNINEVDASFVVYEVGKGVSISARSMGKMNVQVVMENLGGGGHQTMAATQMENINIVDARQQLLEAIDRYYGKA